MTSPSQRVTVITGILTPIYPNRPEAGREADWGSEFIPFKKVKLEVLPCCTKFQEPHVVLEYAHIQSNIIAMKALPSDTAIFNI